METYDLSRLVLTSAFHSPIISVALSEKVIMI